MFNYASFTWVSAENGIQEASTLGLKPGVAPPDEFLIPDFPMGEGVFSYPGSRHFKYAETILGNGDVIGWDYRDVLTGQVLIRIWND